MADKTCDFSEKWLKYNEEIEGECGKEEGMKEGEYVGIFL